MRETKVVAIRPFVPAKDFAVSQRFYGELGFAVRSLGPGIAEVSLGGFGFLLQDYWVEDWAGNFMMQLLVEDVDGWWERIAGLDLAARYGVREPKAPELQPWGLKVGYVVDPAGVLWHVAEQRR